MTKRCPNCKKKLKRCECDLKERGTHSIKKIVIYFAIGVTLIAIALAPKKPRHVDRTTAIRQEKSTSEETEPKSLQEIARVAAEDFISVWQLGISKKDLTDRIIFLKNRELFLAKARKLQERDERMMMRIILGPLMDQPGMREAFERTLAKEVEAAISQPGIGLTFKEGEILVNEDLLVNNRAGLVVENLLRGLLFHEFPHSLAATSSPIRILEPPKTLPGGTTISAVGPGWSMFANGKKQTAFEEGLAQKIMQETIIALAKKRGKQGMIKIPADEKYKPFLVIIDVLAKGKLDAHELRKMHQYGKIFEFITIVGENEFEAQLKLLK